MSMLLAYTDDADRQPLTKGDVVFGTHRDMAGALAVLTLARRHPRCVAVPVPVTTVMVGRKKLPKAVECFVVSNTHRAFENAKVFFESVVAGDVFGTGYSNLREFYGIRINGVSTNIPARAVWYLDDEHTWAVFRYRDDALRWLQQIQ